MCSSDLEPAHVRDPAFAAAVGAVDSAGAMAGEGAAGAVGMAGEGAGSVAGGVGDVAGRLGKVEAENVQLKSLLTALESRLVKLEGGKAAPVAAEPVKAAPVAAAKKEEAEEDDDFDMFGSDEEDDEEVAKRNAQRVADYHAKKAAKAKLAAATDRKSVV